MDEFPCIASLLHCHLSYARKDFAFLLECRGVANHKDFGMSRHGQIFLNAHPTGTIRLHIQPLARWRGRDTGGPDHSLARNALTSDHHAVCDLAYRPDAAPTVLCRDAAGRGAAVVDGLEVLVRQGARSFAIWTGLEADLEVMRGAIRG